MGQGADGLDPNKPVTHADLLPAQGGAGRGEAKGAAVEAIGGAIGGDAGKGAAIGAGVGAAGGAMKKRRSEKEREAAANIPNSSMTPVSKATSLRSEPAWKDGATR